jgi:hypothetical protein
MSLANMDDYRLLATARIAPRKSSHTLIEIPSIFAAFVPAPKIAP